MLCMYCKEPIRNLLFAGSYVEAEELTKKTQVIPLTSSNLIGVFLLLIVIDLQGTRIRLWERFYCTVWHFPNTRRFVDRES